MPVFRVGLFSVVLFTTLGISIAAQVLTPFKVQSPYYYLFLTGAALLITFLLLYRGLLLLVLVSILTIGVNLPPDVLPSYGLDKDILLSVLILMVIFPIVHRTLSS